MEKWLVDISPKLFSPVVKNFTAARYLAFYNAISTTPIWLFQSFTPLPDFSATRWNLIL